MHPTITCKLNLFFQDKFIPKIMILPFLSQKCTHDWQVNSICCKSSPYEQAKQFSDFPFKPEKKTQIKIYAFLNHFNIVCIDRLVISAALAALFTRDMYTFTFNDFVKCNFQIHPPNNFVFLFAFLDGITAAW